jgi:hypothetical protein
MSFTGQFGIEDAYLGNLVLGDAGGGEMLALLEPGASVSPDLQGTFLIGSALTATAGLTADLEPFLDGWEVFDLRDNISARLGQPLLRDIRYRAYERAYTATLNDPNRLVLNVPTEKIAYPPLARVLETSFIRYEATVLPDNDPDPWLRHGLGTAVIQDGSLVIQDTTDGPFPGGQPLFFTKRVDLTFDHVFAMAFRVTVSASAASDGVFTGVAAGYSDGNKVASVGFLIDGTTKKIGFRKRGAGEGPSLITAWTGGLNNVGEPSGTAVEFDWSTIHSYRLSKDLAGNIRLFVDGEVVELLRVTPDELPFLEELGGPFDEIQGVSFGSFSRPAKNESTWDFVRYQIIPTNPLQTAPSSFASYEAADLPENATPPWTPVGYHGTETTLSSNLLLLDSTSATTEATEEAVGLVGGDFRGFMRLEPLLAASSDVVVDWGLQVRTLTSGINPDAITVAIDDTNRLTQVSFFQDESAPKFSYGGRSFPGDSTPIPWQSMGTATATMLGRLLKITDTTATSGLVYYIDDNTTSTSPDRAAGNDSWIMEFRVQVESYTADPMGFCGVAGQVYDSLRAVGLIFEEISGVRYASLASDGTFVTGGRFAFEWNDATPHTYRVVKSALGSLVSLFIDAIYIGSVPYANFTIPPPLLFGVYSFGSSTAASTTSTSVSIWNYFNVWKVVSSRRYVGIWKGFDRAALTGYHLPLKASGRLANAVGNTLTDPGANFIAAGVAVGDRLIIDDGPNKGTYIVASVVGSTALTLQATVLTPIAVDLTEEVRITESLATMFPSNLDLRDGPVGISESVNMGEIVAAPPMPAPPTSFGVTPTLVDYRIPKETDWSGMHTYRVLRDPGGGVALFFDTDPVPLLRTSYDEMPPSSASIFNGIASGISAIAFGAFDPTNLSQTSWDFVRYGITRSPVEQRIVPAKHVLNQRNVMCSPEHLSTPLAHTHTNYFSSSTGIPPQTDPDLLRNPALVAYTRLNQGTPIVPLTQSSDVQVPLPVLESVSGLNRPEDVLNSDGDFTLTDASVRIRLVVPDNVLYNSLQIIEETEGEPDHLAPACDVLTSLGTLSWQNEVCLKYDGAVLPENDVLAGTPWVLVSDQPSEVTTFASSGILTYATSATGTRTAYRNNTPLTDAIGLPNEIKFKIRVANDASAGVGDSQIRFGFSAPSMTLGLGLVTTPFGERYVFIYDLASQSIVGGMTFDFLDGAYHTYRIVRDPSAGFVDLFIDS